MEALEIKAEVSRKDREKIMVTEVEVEAVKFLEVLVIRE